MGKSYKGKKGLKRFYNSFGSRTGLTLVKEGVKYDVCGKLPQRGGKSVGNTRLDGSLHWPQVSLNSLTCRGKRGENSPRS